MTETWVDPPATPDYPDHSTCRHENCGMPISWSEYSYTHDSGFADCRLRWVPEGGKARKDGEIVTLPNGGWVNRSGVPDGQVAEPAEWGSRA